MNILHINQSDIKGGAAIAGFNLHKGLLKQDVNSCLLVGTLGSNDSLIKEIPKKNSMGENILFRITNELGLAQIYKLNTINIKNEEFYKNSDIINFHNISTGYINYLAIPYLTKNKLAVFTLHDMWSYTGHCSYSYECERWKSGCGKCPHLDVYPPVKRDNTKIEWKLKEWVYSNTDLTIVAPSKWIELQAKNSILNRFQIYHIPYGLDLEIFKPLDREYCRFLLGIPKNKKILLFSAVSLNDYRKGGDILIKTLMNLPEKLKKNLILLTFGNKESVNGSLGIETINLGYIFDDLLKSIVYSASNLFVFPSRADNLPLVLLESLACGIPMVSFAIGGISDIVRNNLTGFLVQPEKIREFENAIIEILENDQLRETMTNNCRKVATDEYSIDLQATRYINLYKSLLT